jgi:hypothetical protein
MSLPTGTRLGPYDAADRVDRVRDAAAGAGGCPGLLRVRARVLVRNGTLLGRPFDSEARSFTGEAAAVVDEIQFFAPTGQA